ncbi:DUF1853 family protein [Leptospira sp. GIMC2001]|uniref:DUF1853 family protein n=1 Tax=Leptospira sp. GIMC2001 TaxID=1513297 RepID=UPI002349BB49|nr:DUF1853 family protein [Leptospira sp. GIMC2001]WCL48419.1 DUF1853 family protein [Leptospira sp. GIMC2001]
MSKEDDSRIRKLRQDLVWILDSPSLISNQYFPSDILLFQNTDFLFQELRSEIFSNLDSILSNSKAVLKFFEERKTKRLGRYYETLWEFLFQESENWDLLGRGIPVRSNDSETLGEFDFLLYHIKSNQYIHLEVAIKFYLRLHREILASSYVGPSFNDRLDLKLKKLTKQSILTRNPEAKKYLDPILGSSNQYFHPYILVQGILFYPNNDYKFYEDSSSVPACVNEVHLRSKYIFFRELKSMHSFGSKYILDPRLDWLSDPLESDWKDAMNFSTLLNRLDEFFANRNESVFVSKRNLLHSVSRFFVLPDQKSQSQL